MIDAHGQVSRQQDIILYEEDMCPVFRVLLASGRYPVPSLLGGS